MRQIYTFVIHARGPTTSYIPRDAEPVLRHSHHEGVRYVCIVHTYYASYSIYSWQFLFLRIPQIVACFLFYPAKEAVITALQRDLHAERWGKTS